jgi:hypothetical protein
LKHLAAERWKG